MAARTVRVRLEDVRRTISLTADLLKAVEAVLDRLPNKVILVPSRVMEAAPTDFPFFPIGGSGGVHCGHPKTRTPKRR